MSAILAPTNCQECTGFGVERPATCVAQYQPAGQGKPAGESVILCDSCAANEWTYCNIQPLAKVPAHMEAPSEEALEEAPSQKAPLEGTPQEAPQKAPQGILISKRYGVEVYRVRGGATYKGDRVESHSRRINGRVYDFDRVTWADGTVTVRAWQGGTTNVLHEWQSRAL